MLHVSTPIHEPPRELPDDDGERISITDVRGTIARFEMSYSPPQSDKVRFGPPLRAWLFPVAYLLLAIAIVGLVIVGYNSSPGTRLFTWLVEGDRQRPLSSQVLGAVVGVSALATMLRTYMRGVVINPDWIEARYMLPFGIPRAKRWGWPQVHRVVMDSRTESLALEMMDASFERLPDVSDPKKLRALLLHYAAKKKITVTEIER